jgi:malonate-semialdehyde dehydrogenase (acetylating)/methylmalonate-semialdehyde dehydrogenase
MPPKSALAELLEERMRTIGHFIGGREVKGTSGKFADVFEPMTGDVQAQVALASKAELRAAVENAAAAQPEWGATNPQRRARVMMKFLELATFSAASKWWSLPAAFRI